MCRAKFNFNPYIIYNNNKKENVCNSIKCIGVFVLVLPLDNFVLDALPPGKFFKHSKSFNFFHSY